MFVFDSVSKNVKLDEEYKVQSLTGPGHLPVYKVTVSISGTKKFLGVGNSKQQAEQEAAKKLILSEEI